MFPPFFLHPKLVLCILRRLFFTRHTARVVLLFFTQSCLEFKIRELFLRSSGDNFVSSFLQATHALSLSRSFGFSEAFVDPLLVFRLRVQLVKAAGEDRTSFFFFSFLKTSSRKPFSFRGRTPRALFSDVNLSATDGGMYHIATRFLLVFWVQACKVRKTAYQAIPYVPWSHFTFPFPRAC